MRRSFLAPLALASTLFGCNATEARPEVDVAADRARIEANMATLVRLGEAGDSEASAHLHTKHALLLPPGGDLVEGRGAIAEFMAVPSDATISDTVIETLRLDVDGDYAHHVGRYEFTLTEDGESKQVSGHFVMIWSREPDGWKVAIDMWDRR